MPLPSRVARGVGARAAPGRAEQGRQPGRELLVQRAGRGRVAGPARPGRRGGRTAPRPSGRRSRTARRRTGSGRRPRAPPASDRPGRRAAADVDEEEHLPDVARPAEPTRAATSGSSSTLPLHHGRVDLHCEARRRPARGSPRRSSRSARGCRGRPRGSRAGAVQADRDGLDAAGRRCGRSISGVEQRRDRRRQARSGCPSDGRVRDEVEQVGAQQAVAAGEHEDRVRAAERRPPGRSGRGPRPWSAHRAARRGGRAGPAVPAGEPAGPGGLPEDEHRPLAEVDKGPLVHGGHARAAAAGPGRAVGPPPWPGRRAGQAGQTTGNSGWSRSAPAGSSACRPSNGGEVRQDRGACRASADR